MKGYKKRMVKEFDDLNRRTNKLDKMLRRFRVGKLDFEPDCSYGLLKRQLDAMMEYRECLKIRAAIEDVDLEY